MKIQTVCGPVESSELGNTLIHEHILCTGPEFAGEYADWLPEKKVLEIACKKIRFAADRYGLKTLVDGTPLALGRKLSLLRRVSEETSVHIIASAGFYHYNSFPVLILPEKKIAAFMIREIQWGPIRPGMLKCAVDADGMTTHVRKMMKITALVQKETNLPLFLHTHSANRTGVAALEFLLEEGVPPEKIIVGHTADSNDLSYPLELLEKGCYVSVDRITPENALRKGTFALELIRKGLEKKLFLTHDHVCCWDTILCDPPVSQGEPCGLDTIQCCILPMLQKNGVCADTIEQIFQKNICTLYGE